MTRADLIVGSSLLLAALASTPARTEKTDRIHVADLVIVGEVQSLERDRLRVSTDFMGTVEMDWDRSCASRARSTSRSR